MIGDLGLEDGDQPIWPLWHVPAALFSRSAVGGIEQSARAVVLVIVLGRQYLGRQNLDTEPTPGAVEPGALGALASKNYS